MEGRKDLNVMHPRWNPAGNVLYISDETNWWNIYEEGTPHKNLYKKDIDLGSPQWKFGCDLFSVANNGDIAFINDKVRSTKCYWIFVLITCFNMCFDGAPCFHVNISPAFSVTVLGMVWLGPPQILS